MTQKHIPVRTLLILIPLMTVLSCSTLQRPKHETASSLPPQFDIAATPVRLAAVKVSRRNTPLSYTIPVMEIADAVCRSRGLRLTQNKNAGFDLSILLTETRGSRNFETYYAVTGIVRLEDRYTGKPLFHLFYTEESTGSIRSLYRIFEVIDSIIRRAAAELQRKEHDGP